MYKLFTKRFESNSSIIRPPGFELIRRIYQREILNIVNYYNNRVYSVRSNHLLCRIINTAMAPISYDLDRYMEVLYARSPYIAKHFNFTSEISFGKIHDGIFYGPNVKEILLYNEDYFNPYKEIADWKNIKAIKVLDHPVSDLSLLLPNGIEHDTAEGIASISINVPLLLLQYRGFLIEQAAKLGSGAHSLMASDELLDIDNETSMLSITHFVHMYVLPSMLESHIEIVILNRIMNLFYGAPMTENFKRHPFPVVNYSNKLDKVLEQILKHISKDRMLYYSTLKNIPCIFHEDSQDFLIMPDMAKTRQVWWAMFVSRLKVTKFLIDVGGTQGVHNNQAYINRMKIEVKRLLDENVVERMMTKDDYFDTISTMQELLDI